MKTLNLVFAVLFLISCQGEPGPAGPEGPSGPVGQAFEVQADFNEANGHSEIFSIPDNVEVLESDIVAVYLLWEVDENTGNDVWQPLPASVYFNGSELQYAFDHTSVDVKLFLTGNVDLSTVGNNYTQDQIFRIVVLPVDYAQSNQVDLGNMEEVMKLVRKVAGPK